jgi:membrane fusion protein (multidrug efflux system)
MYIDFSIAAPEHIQRRNLISEGRLAAPSDNRYKAGLRLLVGSMHPVGGEVTFIDSQVQPATGVIRARAVFPNADGKIMPGQYVRLYMEGDVLRNAVLIPQKCVLLTQQGAQVMALDAENRVSVINVTINAAIGDKYFVDSGLRGGERIISEGIVKTRPGAVVRVSRSGDGSGQNPSATK